MGVRVIAREEIIANRRRWIEALRSGEYKQCRGTLYDGTGYCCLGVAEHLFNGEPEQHGRTYRFSDPTNPEDWSSSVLTNRTRRLLGFEADCPELFTLVLPEPEWDDGLEWVGISTSLAELNDRYKFGFEQIADLIEERIDPDWKG